MNRPNSILAVVTIAAAWLPLAPSAGFAQVVAGEEHCVVKVRPDDTLNLRAGPSGDTRVLARLGYRECGVMITASCRNGWCPAEARHQKGFVAARFVSMVSPARYCVTGVKARARLDLKAWPSPGSRTLAALPPNQCGISLLPYAAEGWQKVRVEGWEGWVPRRFLSGQ
jgi:SH3-like domain-containing protein